MTDLDQDLDNQTAVVTGGASGIGLALGQRFIAEGMIVVLVDADGPRVQEAARALGPRAFAEVADVREPAQLEALAERTVARSGPVRVLVNNAGVAGITPAPVWELSVEAWRRVLDTNLMGIVHGVRAFVPRMLASGLPSHIVNTASMSGLVVFPGGGAYGPSKHAAVSLSEQLALELAQRGAPIHVSVLCPAWVKTRILDDPANEFPPNIAEQMRASMQQTGLAPSVVADAVVAAMRERRFYVLPNDEWVPAVTERARRISAGGPIAPPTEPSSEEHLVLWEYVVLEGKEAEFERTYGPRGDWAQLFAKSTAFLGTELVRDTNLARRFVTIDRWISAAAHAQFRLTHHTAYARLDARCRALTESERELYTLRAVR